MSNTVKAGVYGGIMALSIVILFGGWSGLVIGFIAGAVIALVLDNWEGWSKPSEAIQHSVTAGAIAGVIIVLAQLIHDYALLPAAGKTAEAALAPTWPASIASLAATVVAAALMGFIVGLPGRQRQIGLVAMATLIVGALPFMDSRLGLDWIASIISVLIFILLALGLNIVVGYAGLLDLGYAAFFAIGAYTTGLLLSDHLGWNLEGQTVLAFWIIIWIAAGVAAIFGVILGAPTLPLRGDYLAIVTLGFGEIVPIVFRNLTSVTIKEPLTGLCLLGCGTRGINLTGGEAGINPISKPWLPGLGFFQVGQYIPWYFLIVGIILFSVFLINRLRDSRMGRAWAAMREDELAAASMGINIVSTKLLAFSMGATFSGFGGAFYASFVGGIFPSVFDFSVSVIILCMVILGGLGNMLGVIVGGFIIMLSDRLFLPQLATLLKDIRDTSILPNIPDPALRDFLNTSLDPIQWRLMLFGLVLVIMMNVRPEGLIPSARRKAELRTTIRPAPTDEMVAESPTEMRGV